MISLLWVPAAFSNGLSSHKHKNKKNKRTNLPALKVKMSENNDDRDWNIHSSIVFVSPEGKPRPLVSRRKQEGGFRSFTEVKDKHPPLEIKVLNSRSYFKSYVL